MKIAVMGAGAVGCYYGGMRARAGHTVTLIGRAQHVEAVRRDGLLLDTQTFRSHVPVDASTEVGAVAGADLVLFCVKSTDTEAAARQMRPHLKADALVLTLQNGVDNAERAQSVLRQQVAATVVYVGTEMAGPGHVKHHGRGELVVEDAPSTRPLVTLFASAGVPVQLSDNVMGALWAKLIANCAYNALSAITQLPYGRLVEGLGINAVMQDVMQECLAVATASGVTVPDGMPATVMRIAETMAGQFSSTAQDLARGKPSEIDHLNGYVLQKGQALGVPTPVNRTLHALVRLLETKAAALA